MDGDWKIWSIKTFNDLVKFGGIKQKQIIIKCVTDARNNKIQFKEIKELETKNGTIAFKFFK